MRSHAVSKTTKRTMLSSTALLILMTPGILSAQAAPAAAAPQPEATPARDPAEDSAAAGDIVVTARNREERLQDVPLSITALSSETLINANVRNIRDIAYLTPGLTVTSGGSEAGTAPTIRGQTNLNGGAGDPNVAVFLDGIYISNNNAISLGLIDIERVEVVKGPVSALYGRNAFAGAINYVSKRPSTTAPSARVTGFFGNDQQYSVMGVISYPVVKDVLGLRVAAGYEHFGGSYKDSVTGARAGGFEKRDLQASLYLTPTSELTVSAAYYYGDDTFGQSAIAYNQNNCGARATTISPLDPSGLGFAQYCGRFDPDIREVEVPAQPAFGGASGNDRKVNLASLNIGYDFGFVRVTSLTGYTKVTQQRFTDFIGRRFGIPFLLTPSNTLINLQEQFGSDTNTRDFSEEIRVQSEASNPFRFQFGGFYFKGRSAGTTIIGIDGSRIPAGQTLAASNGFGQAVDYVTSDGSISPTRINQSQSRDRQLSGFVGVDYDILTGLTLSGEYRYTNQKKSQLIIRTTGCPSYLTAATATCTGPAPTPFLFPNGTTAPQATFKFSNYRASARYVIAPGSNVYASVANGTKAGGFNQRAVAAADGSQPDLTFDPEQNTTYEIGSKNSFFGNRLQLNIALYHIDTTGIQVSGPSSVPTNAGLVTKNFGSVQTDGFEVEMSGRVATGVRVNAGVGYANPRFGEDAFDFGAAAQCASFNATTGAFTPLIPSCAGRVQRLAAGSQYNNSTTARNALSLDGLRVPRQANWTVSGGFDMDGEINADWNWTSTFVARWESRQYAFNNNISWSGGRTVLNLRVGVENETYALSAYVNNLTNDHTPEIVSVNARLSDFGGDLNGYLPVGRQFGLTATAKF